MLPRFASANSSNVLPFDGKMLGDFFVTSSIGKHGANDGNIGLAQYAGMAPLANQVRAVRNLVSDVVRMRVPPHIVSAVIGRIAVVMASLHSVRSRPDKGAQNNLMKRLANVFAPNAKIDIKVLLLIFPRLYRSAMNEFLVRFFLARLRHDVTVKGANIPAVRNLVKRLKSSNRSPSFHISILVGGAMVSQKGLTWPV